MDTTTQLRLLIERGKRAQDLDLRGSTLADADLSKLSADRLDLRAVDLRRAKLPTARLGNCRIEEAMFEESDWSGSTLRMCFFDGAHGAAALFDNARIEDSSARGINLTHASLRDTKLTGTSFERAILREAVLDGAEGDGVEFRGADLSGATLIGVRFNDADFRGADVRGANLSKGYFRDADFRGALLDGTLFEGADCSGAIFDANAGPYAGTTDEKGSRADELGDTVAALLSNSLSELPGIFADNKDFVKDITDRLQQASHTFSATSKHSPEEWKQWTESFLALAKDEQAVDLETIVKALCDGPIELQNLFALSEDSKDEMLNRVRHLSEILNSAEDEPPDEWKPILEPLIKKTKEGEAFDLKTLIELLSNWLQVSPPE